MLRVADVSYQALAFLLRRYGLSLELQAPGTPIRGSFWGDEEAGIVGRCVYVRPDTPVHSLLHETCHTICMTEQRRIELDRDAGSDELEEAAVCYLQLVLADHIDGVGRERIMQDMDDWGYSFRLGSTRDWFHNDAADAEKFLMNHGLLGLSAEPSFQLRR